MQTKAQRKSAAEPHLAYAAELLRTAKRRPVFAAASANYREIAARSITKSTQILKGKTNV